MAFHDGWIWLAEAVQRLPAPYQQAHRLVLKGVLVAQKRSGRCFVDAQSLDSAAGSSKVDRPTELAF